MCKTLCLASLLGILSAALIGCPNNSGNDGGMDASLSGARGLIRWGSVSCPPGAGDGGAEAGMTGCTRPSQHSSNTGISASPDPTRLRCTARADVAGQTVTIGFMASETHDPATWPGSITIAGLGGATTASPTTVGRPVDMCEVRLNEGGHVAVGRCGAECTVTITQLVPEVQTIVGTIRCTPITDDSMPPRTRTVRNSDGVPGMAADFSIVATSCEPVP